MNGKHLNKYQAGKQTCVDIYTLCKVQGKGQKQPHKPWPFTVAGAAFRLAAHAYTGTGTHKQPGGKTA